MKRNALTILGAAGLVAAALSGQATAATIVPNGSFGFNFTGSLTVNTGDITLATSSKTFGPADAFYGKYNWCWEQPWRCDW